VKIPIPEGHTTPKHSGEQTAGPTTEAPQTEEPPKTDEPPKTTEPPTNPPPTEPPATIPPGGKFVCHSAGFFADPNDPRKFHNCVNFGSYLKDFEFSCGEGSHYDDKLHVCV